MKTHAIAATALLLSACAGAIAAPPAPAAAPAAAAEVRELVKKDTTVGTGAEAVKGKAVLVNYHGWVYDPKAPDLKGELFDSSEKRRVPFGFVVGAGRVIKGWDEGVPGMKEGGKRTLIIPPAMAYGDKGAGGVVPPNATLLFEVELVKVIN